MHLRFYIVCLALWTSGSLATFVVTPIQSGVIVAGNLPVVDEASRYNMTYYSLDVPVNVLTVTVDQISGVEVSINPRGRLPCSSIKYDAKYLCTHKWTMRASNVNETFAFSNGDEAWSVATTWFIGVSRSAHQNAASVIEFTFRFTFNVCAADQVATIDDFKDPMCVHASTYVLHTASSLRDVTARHIVLRSEAPITVTNYENVLFSLSSQSDKLKIALRSAAPPSISGFGDSFDCAIKAGYPAGTGNFRYETTCDLLSGFDFFVVIENTDAAAYSAGYTVTLGGCRYGRAGKDCSHRFIPSDRITGNTITRPRFNLVDHFYFDFAAGTNDTLAVHFAAFTGTGKIIARRNGLGSAALADFEDDVYDITNETLALYLLPQDFYSGGRYFFTVIIDAAGVRTGTGSFEYAIRYEMHSVDIKKFNQFWVAFFSISFLGCSTVIFRLLMRKQRAIPGSPKTNIGRVSQAVLGNNYEYHFYIAVLMEATTMNGRPAHQLRIKYESRFGSRLRYLSYRVNYYRYVELTERPFNVRADRIICSTRGKQVGMLKATDTIDITIVHRDVSEHFVLEDLKVNKILNRWANYAVGWKDWKWTCEEISPVGEEL